jgi:hypothetical protein
VYVDQYEGGPYGRRHIQIKSFDNLGDAHAFVRGSSLPLAVYLAAVSSSRAAFQAALDPIARKVGLQPGADAAAAVLAGVEIRAVFEDFRRKWG